MAAKKSANAASKSTRRGSTTKMSVDDANDLEALSFEDAMSQLETMIERIESGEVGLEESLEQYERGIALFRRCQQILSQAEQRFEKLKIDDADDESS